MGLFVSSLWYPLGKTQFLVQNDISTLLREPSTNFFANNQTIVNTPSSQYHNLYNKKRLERKIDLVAWTIIGLIAGIAYYYSLDKEQRKEAGSKPILLGIGGGILIGTLGIVSLLIPAWGMMEYRSLLAKMTSRCGTKFGTNMLQQCFTEFNDNMRQWNMAKFNRRTALDTAKIRSNVTVNYRNLK